jgi:hypothetical protein
MASYETKVMSVSHEIKSQLAKLLATEDLVVEHRQVETAQFNVHTRVLTLPLWEKASNTVYDLLVGHEVGHALFTPDQDPPRNIPHQFVNIVEDARIEKLMKRKYLGLAKTFFNGYKELNQNDFFSLDGEIISEMNLADRVNLYYKVGNFVDIPFDDFDEMPIVRMIGECETFADVLIAAEFLYKFCKKKKKEETDIPNDSLNSQSQGSNQSASDFIDQEEGENESDQEQPSETDSYGGTSEQQQNTSTSASGNNDEEPEVRTADNLEENLKDLIDQEGIDNVYVELPKVNLDTVIAKNEEIHKEINSFFKFQEEQIEKLPEPYKPYLSVDKQFVEFKRSAQKEVNYLVKEFECRKAADSYARSTTSRTGVLDCSKLHTYKYNEDLFKKITTLADGKNHGLVFVLDWSGSMSKVMEDTCKQLFNLIWFCKKVSIPFEVYAFTCEWRRASYDHEKQEYVRADLSPHYKVKDGLLSIDQSFTMMNILSSKSKDLENQMINIWRIASYFSSSFGVGYSIPERLSLSGTPLNEALVSLHQILPKFQKENKLQKVQCIVLTDGEANQLNHHVEIKRDWESNPYIGTRRLIPNKTFIRDRKLGTTYRVAYDWYKFTDLLLTNLKDNFPSVNFIGIRVLAPRDANSFIRLYYGKDDIKEQEKIQNEWKKTKSFIIKKSGYDAYFGVSATALAQDTEFDVAEDATKAQIKSAFVKSLKTKKLNKKVLGEFISLVV